MGGLTAQKNLLQAPHTHPTLQGTPWGTSVPAQLAHSCQQRAGVWHAGETAATFQACRCGFVASPGQPQVCQASAQAMRGSGLSSPEGLLFSRTQVTFQPIPFSPFSALPSSSAKPWVGTGCRGGREPRLLLTLAPICPKALLGLTLCSCEGTSAVSSCSRAAVGGGPGGAQAPRPARGCAPQEEGRSFSSRRKYACGLEAPLAVKSDLFPILALCREKVSLGEGKGGACKAGSLHPSHCQRRGPRVLHPTCPLPGLPPLCFAPR